MEIEVRIDSSRREPKVVIFTDRMTEEVDAIVKRLSGGQPQLLAGFREGMLEILDPQTVLRVYTAAGKVFAATENGEYTLRPRLYELEETLGGFGFVRISNSEIVNLKKVRGFDLSFAGTICVSLSDGSVTYVSRRYVSKIKQVLGI